MYTAPMNVQNTSSSNSEDLWIHFNNLTALSALNQLGTYGAVTIDVNGTPVFQSAHLNDNTARGNSIGNGGALPEWVKLDSNVGPSASRTVTFEFAYASKMWQQEPGAVFNQYPVLAVPGNECLNGDAYWNGSAIQIMTVANEGPSPTSLYPTNSGAGTGTGLPAWSASYTYYAQTHVDHGVSGSGLPFQIVATEPGISPTDAGGSATILP